MSKSKLGVFSIIALLLLSLTVSMAAAQYETQKTTHVTIDTDGTTTVIEASLGVTYEIQGTPGATGDVTVTVYNGNPQATASVPDGVSLNKFIAIAFDMSASDFTQADITISYSDSDVEGLQQTSIYKYTPESDSYLQLYTTVDTHAKTMTATLASVDDPILAIGGSATNPDTGVPATTWVIVIVSVVIIVVLALFIVYRWRKM